MRTFEIYLKFDSGREVRRLIRGRKASASITRAKRQVRRDTGECTRLAACSAKLVS